MKKIPDLKTEDKIITFLDESVSTVILNLIQDLKKSLIGTNLH